MKVLFQDYTFNATTKQITFNTTDVVLLNQVLIITNVTDNIIIYNFSDSTKGGTLINNVLTLTFDTTSMSNTDSLQIFLDLYGAPSTEATATNINDGITLLRKLTQLLAPIATQDGQQRQRVTIGSMETGIIINSYAGIDVRFQMIDFAKTNYNTGIRANLIFS